jgi:hypothetical protein
MGRREIADCRHADPHHEPCRQSQDCGSAAGSMGKGEGGEEGRTGSEVGLSAWRVFLALSCSDRLVFLIAAAVHRRMCGVDPGAGAGPRAESSWRKHVMSELRDILDMADPYDAHAYFMCGFSCDDCQAELGPDEGFEGFDDRCCRHIADKAKAAGWYVPPPHGPEGRSDIQTCYCPECAKKREVR